MLHMFMSHSTEATTDTIDNLLNLRYCVEGEFYEFWLKLFWKILSLRFFINFLQKVLKITISKMLFFQTLYFKNDSIDWAEIFCGHISRWVLLKMKFSSQNIEPLEFYEPSNRDNNSDFRQLWYFITRD